MGKVFLSYRRSDSASTTGRIYDHLANAIGSSNVFKDVDNLAPGEVFADKIKRYIDDSDTVIVVIGKEWLDASDSNSSRRLDNENDWVRIEVGRGIEKGKRVIPLLVNGAEMPSKEHLPEDLQPITSVQAAELRNGRDFQNDMAGLRLLFTPWYKKNGGLRTILLGLIGLCVIGAFLLAMKDPKAPEIPKVPKPSVQPLSGIVIDKAAWVKGSIGDDSKMPLLDVVISNYTGSSFVISQYKIVIDEFKLGRSVIITPATSFIETLDQIEVTLLQDEGSIEEHLDDPINILPNDPMRLKFEFSVKKNGKQLSPAQLGEYKFRLELPRKGMEPIKVGSFQLR